MSCKAFIVRSLALAVLFPYFASAQVEEKWRAIFTNDGVYEFTSDLSGNLYVFHGSNSITRLNPDGTRLWRLALTNLSVVYGQRGWMTSDTAGSVYVAGQS